MAWDIILAPSFWPFYRCSFFAIGGRGSCGWPPRCAAACSSPMRLRRKLPDTCCPLFLSLWGWLFSERPQLRVKQGLTSVSGAPQRLPRLVYSALLPTRCMQRLSCPSRWASKARPHFSTGWRLIIKPPCSLIPLWPNERAKPSSFSATSTICEVPYENGDPIDILDDEPGGLDGRTSPPCISERPGCRLGCEITELPRGACRQSLRNAKKKGCLFRKHEPKPKPYPATRASSTYE